MNELNENITLNITELPEIVVEEENIVLVMTKKSLYTPAQKKASMTWRAKNRLEYNEYMKPHREKYYKENKDMLSIKKSLKYFLKKELEIFRNILIDY